jgi:hypothetical protein
MQFLTPLPAAAGLTQWSPSLSPQFPPNVANQFGFTGWPGWSLGLPGQQVSDWRTSVPPFMGLPHCTPALYMPTAGAAPEVPELQAGTVSAKSSRKGGSAASSSSTSELEEKAKQAAVERRILFERIHAAKVANPNASYGQIAAKLECHHEIVCRVLESKVKFDGSGRGPPRSLDDTAERNVLLEIQKLGKTEHVSAAKMTDVARAMFISLNGPGSAVPSFGKHWRHDVLKRHKDIKLVFGRRKAMEERKRAASTRPNLYGALMSLKCVFEQLSKRFPGAPSAYIPAHMIGVFDETAVSADRKDSAGTRGYSGGSGVHIQHGTSKHCTAMPLIGLNGVLIANVYISAETAHPPSEAERGFRFKCSKVVFNSSGSCEGNGINGEKGSYHFFAETVVERVNALYGTFDKVPAKSQRTIFVLILDGFIAHKDAQVTAYFAENGVEVVVMSPNLTHLIQVGDRGCINGKIKECTRSLRARTQSMLGGQQPLYQELVEFENIMLANCTQVNVVNAAQQCGYRYSEDLKYVTLTDDSASELIDAREAEGMLFADAKTEENTGLRDPRYLRLLASQRAHRDGVISDPMALVLTERSIAATEQACKPVKVLKAKRGSEDLKVERKRRRFDPSAFKEGKTGTFLLTSDRALETSKAKLDARRAQSASASEKRTTRDNVRKEKDARWNLLKASFQGAEIDHLRTNATVGKYLAGKSESNDLEWAKSFVAGKLVRAGATEGQPNRSGVQRKAPSSAAAAGVYAEVDNIDDDADEAYDSDPDWQG